MESRQAPDVRRSDMAAAYVGQRHAPDRRAASALLERITRAWAGVSWPDGVLTASAYLSTGGDTVLTYVQCREAGAHRALAEALPGPVRGGAVEYRLRASVVPPGAQGAPGAIVIAAFDVDGEERQEKVIGNLLSALDGPEGERPPGMLSANFHTSTDGSRVLNYAEWVSDEAHEAFLESRTHGATRRVSGGLPGVRPIGFRRYRLHARFGG